MKPTHSGSFARRRLDGCWLIELLCADRSQCRRTFVDGTSTRAATIGFEQLRKRSAAAFGVHLLSRLQTYTQQIASENRLQNVLESANHGNGVEIIEESKVRNTEELSLHLALAVGNHARELLFEALYDRSRIGTLRRVDGRHCGCRSCWCKELQTNDGYCCASHFRHDLGVVDERIATRNHLPAGTRRRVVPPGP